MLQPILKEWIKSPFRFEDEYKEGVRVFINFAMKHAPPGVTTCTCPCKNCNNSKRFSFKIFKKHLFVNGMHLMYTEWFLHGEKSIINLMENPTTEVVEEEIIQEGNIEDNGATLRNLVDASYRVNEGMPGPLMVIWARGTRQLKFSKTHLFLSQTWVICTMNIKKATEKLYPFCETGDTTLSVIIELHHLKKKFNWSGNSVTELLKRLIRWFPKGNTLPHKYPTMKKMLKDLGMKAKCIHACENNCILYWKEHEDAHECPQCHTPRFKVKEKKSAKVGKELKEPKKVLRHFPLIPRLKRLYTIPWIAHQMTWHKRADPSWDFMRHPIDSAEWRSLKSKWPEFANEEEKRQFCQILKDLKLPSGFSSNLSNVVSLQPPRLHVQKSHDYHVIMQYLLPVMLQHAYPKNRELKRATMKESMKEFASILFGMQKLSQVPHEGSTPRTEGASNFMQNQFTPQNLNTTFAGLSTPIPPSSKEGASSQNGRQYVMLISREQTEVAKGYIATHTKVCHGRKVAPDETIVWVTEVKDPEALIYEAPQDGHYKLCEIADGGFLIWLQNRLRYV